MEMRGEKAQKTIAFVLVLVSLLGGLSVPTPPALAGNLDDARGAISADNPSDPLFENLGSLTSTELSVLNSEENATLGTMGVEFSSPSFAAIGARLVTLRGGASLLANRNVDPPPFRLAQLDTGTASDARPGAAFRGSPFDFYLNLSGARGDRDATLSPSQLLGEPGFDLESWGVLVGLDYRLGDHLVIGAALGYAETDADFDQSGGDFQVDGVNVLAYGLYQVGGFYLDGTLSLGWNDYDTRRRLSISSSIINMNDTVRADFEGRQNGFSVGGGYDYAPGGWSLGPYARYDFLRTRIDQYAEKTGRTAAEVASDPQPIDSAPLAVGDQEIISSTAALGARVSYAWSTPFGVVLPQIRGEWIHEFDNQSREVAASFIADAGNNTFIITTDDPDEDYFNLGAGLSAVFPHGIGAFVYYETPIALAEVTAHYLTAGVRYEF